MPDFAPDTLSYIRERAQIEVEKPIQLIKYQLIGSNSFQYHYVIMESPFAQAVNSAS